MRAAARALVVAVVLAAAACSSGQDPGVEPAPGGQPGTTSTPQLLQPCPPGGPDETTPPAGCVDPDGNVLH